MIERRVGDRGIGFGAAISSREEKEAGEWFEQVLPEDLMEYGLIPEFIGRLPVVAAIHQLSRDDLITILTEPKHALTKQFQRFFEFDDIELVFAEDSLEAIADKALERETGARGLRSILEETLLDVQFELPSRRDVTKCVVTKETIEQGRRPTLVTEAAPQDIGGVGGRTQRGICLAGWPPSRRSCAETLQGRGYLDSASWTRVGERSFEETTRYEPSEVEGRVFGEWLEARVLPSGRGGDAGGELLGRDPAAECDRGAAYGARAERVDPGRAGADEPDAGRNALWILGTDHAGIATQAVVEKTLRAEGVAATSSAARSSSSGSGSGARSTARGSSSSTSGSAPPATTSASASPSTRAT